MLPFHAQLQQVDARYRWLRGQQQLLGRMFTCMLLKVCSVIHSSNSCIKCQYMTTLTITFTALQKRPGDLQTLGKSTEISELHYVKCPIGQNMEQHHWSVVRWSMERGTNIFLMDQLIIFCHFSMQKVQTFFFIDQMINPLKSKQHFFDILMFQEKLHFPF